MTRYIEVTHTYIIPVPADQLDTIEPVADEGVSIMEGKMKGWAGNLFELRSDWKLLPQEFVPPHGEITFHKPPVFDRNSILEYPITRPELQLEEGQVTFTRDILGVNPQATHPWDQGLRVLPLDHEFAGAETEALKREGKLCDEQYHSFSCILPTNHPGPHLWATDQGVLVDG